MKLDNSLKFAARTFKVVAIINLIGGLWIFVLHWVGLAGLALMRRWAQTADLSSLPDVANVESLLQPSFSVSGTAAQMILSLELILVFFIFRNLASVVSFFRQAHFEEPAVVQKLARTVKLLLGLYVAGVLRFGLAAYFAASFSPALEKIASHPSVTSPASSTSWVNQIYTLLMPTFPGASALVVALFLFLLMRFLEERAVLKNQVQKLEQEAEFTI